MNAAPPTYHQVLELPTLLEEKVTPEFIDVNGHMNVRHYLDAGALGADVLCRQAGIDDDYRDRQRRGVFTAEHHIRYFREMHQGAGFSVRTALSDRSDKAGHLLSFILDRDAEALACTVEIILISVGMDTRRPEPFADDVVGSLDTQIETTRRLTWDLPLCGAMGIRRA